MWSQGIGFGRAGLDCCRHEHQFGPSERTALYKYLRDPAQCRACICLFSSHACCHLGFPIFVISSYIGSTMSGGAFPGRRLRLAACKLSKHFAASYWPCGLARKASSRMPRNSLAATTSQRACPCHSFLGTARLLCLSCQSVDRWHVVQQIVKPSCAEHGAPIALVRNGSFGSKTSRPTWEFLKTKNTVF